MPTSSRTSRGSRNYQQELVTCRCQQCRERSEGGRGLKVPRYTARKHAEWFPRHKIQGIDSLDPRYVAQPFRQRQLTSTSSQTAASSIMHSAVQNLEETQETTDVTMRPDECNSPVFDEDLQPGWNTGCSVVGGFQGGEIFLNGTSYSFSR